VSSSTGKIDVTVGRISAAVAAVAALVAGAFVVPAVTGGSGSSCNTTLTSGQSVSTALSSVTAGGTVCLGAGTYSFSAATSKSAMTKVTLAGGVTRSQVTITALDIQNGANNLWFDGMTVGTGQSDWGNSSGSPTNIKLTGARVTGTICINARTNSSNVLIDSSLVVLSTIGCQEGAISVVGSSSGANGVTISNTEFTGSGADAIQLVNGARGTVIGPGNYFHDIRSGGVHADAIQPYGADNITVTGNYFTDNDGTFSDFDCRGSDGLVFTDNVVERGDSSQAAVAISGATTATITHNTLGKVLSSPGNGSDPTGLKIYAGNTPSGSNDCGGAGSANTNMTVTNNILPDCSTTATSSTFNYNVTTVSACRGANGFNGAATYTPNVTGPSSFAGYLLGGGSLGKLGGSDGADVGAHVATMTGAWP
jgi:hypothetical protein